MKNAIDYQIERQGKWLRQAVEIIFDCPVADVLSYVYTISTVEAYLEAKKIELRTRILQFMKEHKQYQYRETSDPIEIETVIEYALEFEGNITKFKAHLKKASAFDLRKYEIALFENDTYYKNDLFN